MRNTDKSVSGSSQPINASEARLSRDRCDRCFLPTSSHIVSYFNSEAICMTCLESEREVFRRLREQGRNPADYAGCGHVPEV